MSIRQKIFILFSLCPSRSQRWEIYELQMWKIIKGCICLSALYKLAAWSSCHKDNLFYSMLTGWYSAIGGNNSCLLSASQYALAKYSIKNTDKLEWSTLRIIWYAGGKKQNKTEILHERERILESLTLKENVWRAVIIKRYMVAPWKVTLSIRKQSMFETNLLAWNLP